MDAAALASDIASLATRVTVVHHGRHGIKPWGVTATLPLGWAFDTLDAAKTVRNWPAATKERAEHLRALIIAGIAARMVKPDADVSPQAALPCLIRPNE